MRPPDRAGTSRGHCNPGPASVSTVARVLRERVQASLFIVPNDPNELAYADFAWEQPIGSDGFVAFAFGYVSRVNESDTSGNSQILPKALPRHKQEPFSYNGLKDTAFANGMAIRGFRKCPSLLMPDPHSKAHQMALRGGYPIIRSRDRNLWVRASPEMTNLTQSFAGFEIPRDRLRVARTRLDVDATDDLGGVTFATPEVGGDLGAFSASHEGEALLSRADGRPTVSGRAGDTWVFL